MFSAEELMIPLASMFDYDDAPPEQRTSTRRSATVQKDYTWIHLDDDSVSDFVIQWNESLSKKEKDFYRSKYPRVDDVMNDRVHCTSCDCHLSTAPIDETYIREHPVLKTSQCSKCYSFYTSGEFDKGEDGSELYCRWCGQGGEVYCCAQCPYVFCKKCILRNMNKSVLKEIEENEDWVCFSCKPEPTWPLRARHWALTNFIEKQRKIILTQYTSDADVNFMMSRDMTKCCASKQQSASKEAKKSSSKASSSAKASPAAGGSKAKKRKADSDYTPPVLPAKRLGTATIPPLEKQPPPPLQRSQDEVVCTPDIMSMFEPNNATTSTSTSAKPSPPPPLTSLRQYGGATNPIVNGSHGNTTITRATPQKKTQTITIANQSPATPIYHTINGYRIDLNSAARQETIRLPNGKLIQVKKQSTPQASAAQQINPPPSVAPLMSPPVRNIRPQMANVRPPIVPRAAVTPVRQRRQPASVRGQMGVTTSQASTQQQQQNQQRPLVLNGMIQPQALNIPPLIISQQMANTPYGKAKMELDSRIRNGQEICMHIIGKMNTLVASNAYKTMKNPKDVKEIHIHLSYLISYAINRFKTLQEKSMENMKALGFGGDVESIMSGKIQTQSTPDDDDDIEIVEPQTTLIDLASDEEDAPAKVTQVKAVAAKEVPGKRSKGLVKQTTSLRKNPLVAAAASKDARQGTENDAEVADTVDETPIVRESQMFLDKLKLQPKILLKKLSGSALIDAKIHEKENEGIVRDILNEIFDNVMDNIIGERSEKSINGDGIDLDETNETSEEASKEKMSVDESVFTIDDDDSTDVPEVAAAADDEKVQNEDKSDQTKETPKELDDVEMTEADKEASKDDPPPPPAVTEDEDVEMKSPEETQDKNESVVAAEEPKKDEDNKKKSETEAEIPDTNSILSNDDFKDAEDAVLDSLNLDELAADKENPEASDKNQLESPASPDPVAELNQEFRVFEEIDSPDEFDDALEGQTTNGDALLNDLDSLGKFLEN